MRDDGSHFFATLARLKFIQRWALMRNAREETLSEHSQEVATIAHALCILANRRHGQNLDANRAALLGLYHDASEIITGDMPTPVKYANPQIREAYHDTEHLAKQRLLDLLPEDLRADYEQFFFAEENPEDAYLCALVKAADKLSALIKCIEEKEAGNREFRTAEESCRAAVLAMAEDYPEVRDFIEIFLPSYGMTLDQLLHRD